ncbi:MAG: alanine racemase [Myxococcota bacterium]|jgi:alanine racemase|nr:alanine racemase [Myxococcota bacterium]
MKPLIWCEIDCARLQANLARFRRLVGPDCLLAPTVKANAYGHGGVLAATAFCAAGADWLTVNSLPEARELRQAGIGVPLYVMGYVAQEDLAEAVALDCRLVVYDEQRVDALGRLVPRLPPGCRARLHLKIETGNNRQGLDLPAARALARRIAATPGLVLEGAATHFADIEDTTDHTYARQQLARFRTAIAELRGDGHPVPVCHCANTAATILWPESYLALVRVGIGAYGMWPSVQTQVAAVLEGRPDVITLEPALTWKTRIAQLKDVPAGEFVGYGRTFRTTHPTRLAVLPVGYYDGYDRRLSNLAYVLVRGQRAPLRGRVCMNMCMVDVTDVPGVTVEEEAILLGGQGAERLSAEQLAEWTGTINYEVTTRIPAHVPRLPVGVSARPSGSLEESQ